MTMAPGGATGWHYHPGQVLVIVESGTLTRVLHDGTVETTPAGAAFVEEGDRGTPISATTWGPRRWCSM
ncbi:cupin domain-containing protein [Streptacidiphilus griseoplanus]|uniref:cupin domain-containing protein n=1 Tax=Peterkaempfera griseoplana TaxID=66896 RepID=UPI001FE236FB|nr:cupin domain-containing protein [Peterkaempfera griseoplana]